MRLGKTTLGVAGLLVCLIVGLFVIQRMGYYGVFYQTTAFVPGELVEALDRVKNR